MGNHFHKEKIMKYRQFLPAVLALALLFSAPVMAEDTKQSPAAPASAQFEGKAIKGTITQTMDAGGYTYIQLDNAQGKVWVAIPQTKVTKGQEVTAKPGMVMADFESKTLKKTFDVIVFSSGLGGDKIAGHGNKKPGMGMGGGGSFDAALQAEAQTANPHGGMGGAMAGAAMGGGAAMAQQSGGSSTAIVPAAEVKVEKATGDNAQSVADCFANAKALDNKKVQVRGKVMKVSRMIMGKNWVHLQDGTGNPMKNTHDLVVTTMAEPAKDSVVVIEGILHADKDFGAGYKYDVIIEDAVVK
jgi:hypothetical protein